MECNFILVHTLVPGIMHLRRYVGPIDVVRISWPTSTIYIHTRIRPSWNPPAQQPLARRTSQIQIQVQVTFYFPFIPGVPSGPETASYTQYKNDRGTPNPTRPGRAIYTKYNTHLEPALARTGLLQIRLYIASTAFETLVHGVRVQIRRVGRSTPLVVGFLAGDRAPAGGDGGVFYILRHGELFVMLDLELCLLDMRRQWALT